MLVGVLRDHPQDMAMQLEDQCSNLCRFSFIAIAHSAEEGGAVTSLGLEPKWLRIKNTFFNPPPGLRPQWSVSNADDFPELLGSRDDFY